MLDIELFVVFEFDVVASTMSPFGLEITMGSTTDEQDDSGAWVVVTVAAVVVIVG
jgi:hypothetical protein